MVSYSRDESFDPSQLKRKHETTKLTTTTIKTTATATKYITFSLFLLVVGGDVIKNEKKKM